MKLSKAQEAEIIRICEENEGAGWAFIALKVRREMGLVLSAEEVSALYIASLCS